MKLFELLSNFSYRLCPLDQGDLLETIRHEEVFLAELGMLDAGYTVRFSLLHSSLQRSARPKTSPLVDKANLGQTLRSFPDFK